MAAERTKHIFLVAGGLLVGLCIGLATTAGVLLGRNEAPPAWLQELRLKASSSDSGETMAIATGAVDEEVEGLFTLDFITGELNCFIINPRTGSPAGIFKTNIAGDLPVEKGKKPSYALVTGLFQFKGATGNARPALSLVYVADLNTGNVVGYSFEWNRSVAASNVGQRGELKRVVAAKARSTEIRE